MSDSEPPKNTGKAPDDEAPEDEAEEPSADAAPAANAGPTRRSRRRPAPASKDGAGEDASASEELDEDDAEDKDKEKKPRPNYLFLVVASVIFLAMDLLSKEWAVKRLSCKQAVPDGPPCELGFACDVAQNPPVCVPGVARPDQHVVVIENFFHFDLATNKGGAWGLLGDQPDTVRLPFFFLISALAVVFIVSLYRKLEPHQAALKWALPLVLGGALGNLVDRVRHQHVIDFIDWFMGDSHWPTFNIADVWIVAGVILMVADMFTPKRKVRRGRTVAAGAPVPDSGEG